MTLLLVAATPFEILPLSRWLEQRFSSTTPGIYTAQNLTVRVLVTGIGQTATAWHLSQELAHNRPDLALNLGIAGALDRNFALTDVVQVVSERFADLGIETADGHFLDLFESDLQEPDTFPFAAGCLLNPAGNDTHFLPQAAGITVNRVHGYEPSVAAIRTKHPMAQVESMEGAAFFYGCIMAQIPFLEIRAISNYVEKRDRSTWQIQPAIEQLNAVAMEIIASFL